MDAEDVVNELKAKLDEFDSVPTIQKFHEGTFRAWAFEVDSIIIRGTGSGRLVSKWRLTIHGLPYPNNIMVMGYEEGPLEFMFKSRLPEVRATLAGIIEELGKFGLSKADDESPIPRAKPAVFVAHGGNTEALNRLCSFLEDDLGIKPIVVERLPSEGRSVNENVEHYLNLSDAAIVLATGDDLVDGRYQARGNVHVELGRFQERFPGKVIYLLEHGAAFPSNVSEKVWERFSQDNMESALRKAVRELRAFGLLGIPRE